MKALLAITSLGFGLVAASAAMAVPFLTEQQAHARAVAILKGAPYGETYAEIGGHIKAAARKADAQAECGRPHGAVWVFSVYVPAGDAVKGTGTEQAISGPLVIDAKTGKMVCAGLPFLD